MYHRHLTLIRILCGLSLLLGPFVLDAEAAKKDPDKNMPAKVYVPYDKLKEVFESEQQGVFLPYKDFQKLWQAAQGKPKDVSEAPFEYLVSTARFKGQISDELAEMTLELTVDILGEGWVDVPIGLGEVGVANVQFIEPAENKIKPLLRVVDGRYILTTKGKGRYVMALDFVRQLEVKPGLNVVAFKIPRAAVTTLELMIPEENLKVDVEPMLAATTSQVEAGQKKLTRLKAFLGSAGQVKLSWKPKTEAAAELEPVLICEQMQHINITEALVNYQIKLDYTIRRGGVDSFTVKLPGGFRVTDVSGANISKWDITTAGAEPIAQAVQVLEVKLFSPAKDKYTLTLGMEQFLQQDHARFTLAPVVTEQVLRRSGLIAITCSPRRLYNLKDIYNLARVDTGRLPSHLHNRPGLTAYRFITSDYAATLQIEKASPRINVTQSWMLGVDSDRLHLRGQLRYKVERTGIFELEMSFPEPWKIESLGPDHLVDDYQLKGEDSERLLHILLRRENIGEFVLNLSAVADRQLADEDVDFTLPLADAENLQLYQGNLILLMAEQLRAESKELRQFQAISLRQVQTWTSIGRLSPAMAFEFRAIDRAKAAGVTFKIAVKPPQVSAVVHRLVNIQPASIRQEALIQYRVRYAPVDTFYIKIAEQLVDRALEITGKNIKEKPRIEQLPPDQREEPKLPEPNEPKWAYYKVVLQSKVTGTYKITVRTRKAFQAGKVGQSSTVEVEPILAAGKLSDQNGYIAIAKADMLAIGEPKTQNLVSADPGSAADLPYDRHRRIAALAFKYNAPPFELSFPVVTQKEAAVFTTIVTAAIIEQVLGRDGTLNTHATYLLQTAKGDRIPIALPPGAQLTAVLLNNEEAAVEMSASADQRIVRLPPSAGQVSRFVLEVSYGLKKASVSNLGLAKLPQEIPVQQTLWRLWVPQDYYLLGHDRVFARLDPSGTREMLQTLRRKQPTQITFKLPSQGSSFDFVRQGAPEKLSVIVLSKETFSIIVWILIIAAGLVMLKFDGFKRVIIILAVALLCGLLYLYLPLLVQHAVEVGLYAAILVVLLWIGQWAFLRLPKIREALPAKVKSQEETAEKPSEKTEDKPQSKQDKE
jgi:hypothetical protein